ncbi:MAG: LLM class F420-dependent oxidoreductase [Deltaproteobacteria bacterium]|nr:LLM class F420-dependent oxidoreductase [Deltaproteobacteria bacterium]
MKFLCSLAFSGPSELAPLARHADATGWDMLSLSDHLVFPEELSTPYPYTPDGKPFWDSSTSWPDCFVTIGALASVTERIRFVTNVYVLPARNPFVVAKAAGTAAVLSNDRVILGIGSGWMKDEFDLTGEDFATRGSRTSEMIDVLRKLWRNEMVEHHGEHYDFGRLQMSPAPTRPVPIYSGGSAERVLRRTARKCDGWLSPPSNYEDLKRSIGALQKLRREYGREKEPFEYVVTCRDRSGVDGYRELEDLGATAVMTAPWVRHGGYVQPLDVKKRSLEEFADQVIARMR